MKKSIIKVLLVIFPGTLMITAKAQQGFGTSNPDPSSVIDMTATNKGALLPRIALSSTSVAAPVNAPANGLTVFNTATTGDVTPGYYYWSVPQMKWVRLLTEVPEQDLRLVANKGHITQDAGIGSNGTSAGTGLYNIGIGEASLNSITSAFANIGIGQGTLSSVTDQPFNIALGTISLNKTTSGFNTALGHGVLYDLTTGVTILLLVLLQGIE